MQFSQVIGHENLKKRLAKSVLDGRIPHAQMFYGPEGCGSLALAIAYAQYVCCLDRTETDSCGHCNSCHKFEKLAHPDLHFAFPVNTSKEVGKDPVSDDYLPVWRDYIFQSPYFRSSQWYSFMGIENKQGLISKFESEAIIRKLSLKSFESDYKILIMWLPEKMNATASNMLLKLIEEPPMNTVFLLVSEFPDEVLLTISSRTQPVKMGRLTNNEIAGALIKSYQISDAEAASLARLANGNYIAAKEAFETSEETGFNFTKFVGLMRSCYKRNFAEINEWVDEMSGLGREQLKSFFGFSLRMLRENFMMNLNKEELVYLSPAEAQFSEKFHVFINGRNIVQISEELNAAYQDIERNANSRIVLFDTAAKISRHIRL